MKEIFYEILSYSLYYDNREIEDSVLKKARWIYGDSEDLKYLINTKIEGGYFSHSPHSKSFPRRWIFWDLAYPA